MVSSLVNITDRVNTCLKSAETHRKQANALRQSLTVARQHRFMRPLSPIHPSWNVGLPDQQTILEVLSSGSPDDLVLSDRGFRITRKTMQRLAWPAVSRDHYLDTSIIDTYLALLSEYVSTLCGDTKMHIVSPMISLKFFPTAYGPHDLDGIIDLGAIRHIPLKDLDLLVFPLNPRGTEHWWSVVFNFRSQEIRVYNSSPSPARNSRKYVCALKALVTEMFTRHHNSACDWAHWSVAGPEGTPKQANAYDCGVFLCMTITYVALQAPLNFTQDDMSQCRQHIAQRIISNKYYTSDTGKHRITSPGTEQCTDVTPIYPDRLQASQ